MSVAVMAHPKREKFIPELLASLDRPAEVVFDRHDDRWDTGRRSMLAYDPAASHHLVVQDDAIVCRDLVAGVEKALPHVPPQSPVCLYIGTLRPWPAAITRLVKATKENTSWVTMGQLNWGVAVVMPTCHIDEMTAWGDHRPDVANYDKRMSRWLEHRAIPVWYTWPSLVDHRDSPSLIKGRAGRRHAHRFVGAEISALSVRFDGGVVTDMPALVRGGHPRRRSETRRWRHRDGRVRKTTIGSGLDLRYESLDGWEELVDGESTALTR